MAKFHLVQVVKKKIKFPTRNRKINLFSTVDVLYIMKSTKEEWKERKKMSRSDDGLRKDTETKATKAEQYK